MQRALSMVLTISHLILSYRKQLYIQRGVSSLILSCVCCWEKKIYKERNSRGRILSLIWPFLGLRARQTNWWIAPHTKTLIHTQTHQIFECWVRLQMPWRPTFHWTSTGHTHTPGLLISHKINGHVNKFMHLEIFVWGGPRWRGLASACPLSPLPFHPCVCTGGQFKRSGASANERKLVFPPAWRCSAACAPTCLCARFTPTRPGDNDKNKLRKKKKIQ